jgi:hypothetical protein
MDTNALKRFAQAARNLLIDQVTAKLAVVVDPASSARRENPAAIKKLDAAIAQLGQTQVIEQVAYTWFNRFTALRFMDVNGYTNPRVVSPEGNATRPELLAEAIAGNLPEGAPATIAALLDGRTPSRDPQGEAYRLLLVHACNAWHATMPFIFEKVGDYTELLMPEDLLSQTSILARLRDAMPEDDCKDVEIIGWLYQFYISEKKDQVFAGLKKNQKITAENIPAATQLFTPHWIVRYLVENSLGRLWLLNRPSSKLAERMDYYIAPEEPETDFLKIGKPEEIKVCDPACGSGHMLTYAFDLLHAIYEEEGYEADKIPALILQHNLTGIEIDDRAGALAAFALAMKASEKLGRRRFLRMDAKPDIAVLQNVSFTSAEMQDVLAVVGRDLFTDELRETLLQFEQSKNFGSLIVPKLRDPAETLRLVQARDFDGDLLLKEVQDRVMAVLRMAEALSPKYHVVVANPPYMTLGNANSSLNKWTKSAFPTSSGDLFSAFIERGVMLAVGSGYSAMITMQTWLFISSYKKLREQLILTCQICGLLNIGYNTFPEMNSKVALGAAFIIRKATSAVVGTYIDLNKSPQSADKESVFLQEKNRSDNRYSRSMNVFRKIPGWPFAFWVVEPIYEAFDGQKLGGKFEVKGGMSTSDNDRFLRNWFEVSKVRCSLPLGTEPNKDARWFPYNKGGGFRKWYGNWEFLVDWEDDGSDIKHAVCNNPKDPNTTHWSRRIFNTEYFFEKGITWGDVTTGPFSARLLERGAISDSVGIAAYRCQSETMEWATLAVLNANTLRFFTDILCPTIHFNSGPMSKIPFPKTDGWVSEASRLSQTLSRVACADWDAYETSWDFNTLPLLSPDHRGVTLAESYATLRAHWQSMTDEMKALEEENNRIFIDAYGLQDELTPEVPIEEITLTCNPAYRYGVKGTEGERETRLRADTMAEFLSYAVGCMFGRYSLDASDLILANEGETLADYLARVPEPSFMPDEDNVIPVLDADWFADDIVDRFRKFLRVTFGEEHFRENLAFIEAQIGDIRRYFTKGFYDDHVKRYKKRPIYWMFASPKGTFQALIYMHRYRPDTISVLLNDYLREFIRKLEGEREKLEKLSDDPTATQTQRTRALKDVATVAKQIAELEEWERDVIFPLAQAKIEIDLDDGVKRNYPLFGAALKPIKGLEAADE